MIVAHRFVLLHLHKSGGSFANQLVLAHIAGAREIGYHLPRKLIPAGAEQLPVLGFVRNPWSYYVSWFAFQQQRPQQNLLYRVLSRDGTLGFAATITNMLELGTRDELLDALVAGLPQHYGNRGLNLPGPELAAIRATDQGFYSFLYQYMFGGEVPALHVGQMENLRDDFPRLLELVGQTLPAPLRSAIQSAPARNVSQHGKISDYYNSALRDLVAIRDVQLVEQYQYRLED